MARFKLTEVLLDDEPRLRDVVAAVDANRFEQFMLWQEHHRECEWVHDSAGYMIQLGTLADMPVCLSISFAVVDKRRIVFHYMCSMVTDGRMEEAWLDANFGEQESGDRRKVHCTDAMNFGNALNHIRRLNTQATTSQGA